MADRRKFIKSSSGYVRKSLHQLTPDGNIYEHDYMTINEMPVFAPDQVPIYGDSNFIFTVRKHTNGQYNVVNGAWVKPDDDEFWTSENVGEVDKTTTDSSCIKPYFSNLTDYAYYGSAVELIRATINKVIKSFPAGIYITKKQFSRYRDMNGDLVSVLDGKYLVENPFHIDISSASVGNVLNPYRYFCLKSNDFCIDGTPITWSVKAEERKKCLKNGDLLRTVTISSHKIYYYFVDGIEIACSTSSDVLIRPQDYVFNAFFRDLDDFGKVLLNKDTNPRYKSSFDTYYEVDGRLTMSRKEYVWPIAQNGYNLEISDNRFKDYIQGLSEMASFYDEIWSDNFYRAMAHESVKNLDWTFARFSNDENITNEDLDFSRMQMILRIYGRQLDEIKRYIDGIGFVNNLSYNQENNPTDYTLSDSLELAGWEVKNLFSKDDGLFSGILYNGESVGYTITEANNEFLRRLKLNSPYIFSQKGTKRGIRTLLSVFGMEEGLHYDINEKVYKVSNTLNKDLIESYNRKKTSFNVTYQGEYGDLSGIPVKDINGELVPWFDSYKKYDSPMYFEMDGGWDGRDTLTVSDINGKEIDLTGGSNNTFYKETQKHVKYVNDIEELLNLPNNFVKNGDFVYVFNINDGGLDLETSSHYFYIENTSYMYEIDYNWNSSSTDELKGWYPLTIDEISVNKTSKLGEKLLLYLSYREETIGNNPHFGNKKYDGGQSWKNRFNSIFKESIEKMGAFVGVDGVVEETVAGIGFNITINNTSGKTYAAVAKPYRVTADVPYLRRKHDDGTNGRIDYNNELNDPKLSILSTSDNMFTITVKKYNPETGRYDLSPEKGTKMYFKNSYTADSNKDDYTQQVTLPDNGVYGRSNSSSATWSYVSNIQAYITVDGENIGINIPVIGPNDEGNITGIEMKGEIDAAKILNSKQMEITFSYGTFTKEFIEEYVLFYLKQIIPSTTIFKIIYKPMDTVYGITINNR